MKFYMSIFFGNLSRKFKFNKTGKEKRVPYIHDNTISRSVSSNEKVLRQQLQRKLEKTFYV